MSRDPAALVRYWNRTAPNYDAQTTRLEPRFMLDSRRWVCSRATGETLELACGTGANFAHYPAGVVLTATDWSDAMLAVASRRPAARRATLRQADAGMLPFPDASFDTVTCTFALCAVPDERAVLIEALRVLRPGGSLLLADHVVATNWALRQLQHLVDLFSVTAHGEHYARRPFDVLTTLPAEIVATERLTYGAIERIHARKPQR
jgi:ubiquinone/menaquinone biosynthesis C-methylase UbiE